MSSTLQDIREKVRRITGRPSIYDLPDAEIDAYVNTYYTSDFPEELRLLTLKTNYTFFTKPNIDAYYFDINEYITIGRPIYIAGYEQQFYENQEAFFNAWPKINFEQRIGTGNGSFSSFSGTVTNVPFYQGSFSISFVVFGITHVYQDNGKGVLEGEEIPISSITLGEVTNIELRSDHGYITGDTVTFSGVQGTYQLNDVESIITVTSSNSFSINIDSINYGAFANSGTVSKKYGGTINYLSGELNANFGVIPDAGSPIVVQTVPYQAGRPLSVLFFNNEIKIRPVPDKAYKFEAAVFSTPNAFLSSQPTSHPILNQWWQLIALGAAIKIFEDAGELENAKQYESVYEKQLTLVERKTLVQLSSQKVSTPFNEDGNQQYGGSFFPY